jgi:uncharacterized membrane protein YoaK (UPF0700 family)
MNVKVHKNASWFEVMLVLLACVAGSVDVMSYFRLGHVFTANMTGNTILLGLSIGQGKMAASLHSLAALGGFFAGSLIGAFIVENTTRSWSYYVTLSTIIETIIILLLVLIWFEEPEVLSNLVLYASILLAAVAMGIQSATIRHLNIPGVVTTFLTGTITSIGMSTISGIKKGYRKKINEKYTELPMPRTLSQRIELQIIVFLAYGATAVVTGWMEYHGSRLLPLLPLTLIIIVLVIVMSRPVHPHILSNLFGKNSTTIND